MYKVRPSRFQFAFFPSHQSALSRSFAPHPPLSLPGCSSSPLPFSASPLPPPSPTSLYESQKNPKKKQETLANVSSRSRARLLLQLSKPANKHPSPGRRMARLLLSMIWALASCLSTSETPCNRYRLLRSIWKYTLLTFFIDFHTNYRRKRGCFHDFYHPIHP
jgi:hypothetical protein